MPSKSTGINVWVVDKDNLTRSKLVQNIERTLDLFCGQDFDSGQNLLKHLTSGYSIRIPDVLLVDIDTCKTACILAIKSIVPQTALVFMTPSYSEHVVLEALNLGAASVILQRPRLEQLLKTIREVNKGVVLFPPEMATTVLSRISSENEPFESGLTNREREILVEMSKGLSQKEIASNLTISHHTVNTHVQHIYSKLDVKTGIQAVVKAIKTKLI